MLAAAFNRAVEGDSTMILLFSLFILVDMLSSGAKWLGGRRQGIRQIGTRAYPFTRTRPKTLVVLFDLSHGSGLVYNSSMARGVVL